MASAPKKRPNGYKTPGATNSSLAYDLEYDGGAVRQPRHGGAEVLRPQPRVRPRERALERPRVQVREAGHVSLFAVVGFLAVGVFAALLLMSFVQLTVATDQVVSLRGELSGLQAENTKLLAQYELAYDLSSIEAQVTASGSMVKPQSGQIYTIDLSERDSVVRYDGKQSAQSAETGILDEVKSVFGGILEYFR